MPSAQERRERLKQLFVSSRDCQRCALHRTRTQVVFGTGNADAELMFVGEAPGANEDRQGLPFVGQAGKLLERLLGEIGMARGDVFIANVLMCRPPDNRDPHPQEIEACEGYLREKIELIQPAMIATLGNFATRLLRGDPTSISRLHGREEVRMIGSRAVRLYPLYHPAAALYHPVTLGHLRADFARIPQLLALGAPPQPPPLPDDPEMEALRWLNGTPARPVDAPGRSDGTPGRPVDAPGRSDGSPAGAPAHPQPIQLGLF